jgi:hypothetical protein
MQAGFGPHHLSAKEGRVKISLRLRVRISLLSALSAAQCGRAAGQQASFVATDKAFNFAHDRTVIDQAASASDQLALHPPALIYKAWSLLDLQCAQHVVISDVCPYLSCAAC